MVTLGGAASDARQSPSFDGERLPYDVGLPWGVRVHWVGPIFAWRRRARPRITALAQGAKDDPRQRGSPFPAAQQVVLTASDGGEGGPVPKLLVAVTVKVWLPTERPSTVTGEPVDVLKNPPGAVAV
jgi:hypothetical protein